MGAQENRETSCGGSKADGLTSPAAGWNVCVSISREHAVVSLEKGFSWNPEVIVVWYN